MQGDLQPQITNKNNPFIQQLAFLNTTKMTHKLLKKIISLKVELTKAANQVTQWKQREIWKRI